MKKTTTYRIKPVLIMNSRTKQPEGYQLAMFYCEDGKEITSVHQIPREVVIAQDQNGNDVKSHLSWEQPVYPTIADCWQANKQLLSHAYKPGEAYKSPLEGLLSGEIEPYEL